MNSNVSTSSDPASPLSPSAEQPLAKVNNDNNDSFYSAFSIPPTPFLLVCGAFTAYRARRGYIRPLEDVLQRVLQKHQIQSVAEVADNEVACRALGFAVARRALNVATNASISAFCFVGAFGFAASGCTTWMQGINGTKSWARHQRRKIDNYLGITDKRVDEDSPEYQLVQNMSEEEEMEYYHRVYFTEDDEGVNNATEDALKEKADVDDNNNSS